MADKKISNSTGIIIGAFIALLMGAILIAIVSDNTVTKSKLTGTSTAMATAGDTVRQNCSWNESYIYPLGTKAVVSGWRLDSAAYCTPTIIMTNASGTRFGTQGTDYKYYSANGSLVMMNTSDSVFYTRNSNATITANFEYCADDYLSQEWSRTIFNMVPGFFAIAILLSGAFLIYYIAKREGFEL